MIKRASALLRVQENSSAASVSIHGWLGKASSTPSSITEVQHPLSSSPAESASQETTINEIPMQKVKEEPLFPKSTQPAQLSSNFTAAFAETDHLNSAKQRKTPSPAKNPQLIAPVAPKTAPRKSKAKVQGLSILRSALKVPLDIKLLVGGRKPTATSTPQNIAVRYNPHSCCLGGLPTGSIEMKELKSPSGLSPKKEKPSE